MKKFIIKLIICLFFIFILSSKVNIISNLIYAQGGRWQEDYAGIIEKDEEYDDEGNEINPAWYDIPGQFEKWIYEKINEAEDNLDELGTAILKNVIFPENNGNIFKIIYNALSVLVKSITFSLILLSALFYGFKVYILWKDGNPEENPIELITRYLFAVALILCFDEIYQIFGNIVLDIINKIYDMFVDINIARQEVARDSTNILNIIYFIVWLYQYLLALFNTLKKGIETFIMRLGFPLACINIIQPQAQTYNSYMSTLIKNFFVLILNVLLINMAKVIRQDNSLPYSELWGIACLLLLNNSGQMISQFIIPNQGGSAGLGSKMQTAGQVINMGKNLATGFKNLLPK